MVKRLLEKIHNHLGDFWWYSAMLFCASRVGDCVNLFVGLWLVPKYVDPTQLGAVTPLTSIASFIAFPAGVFGTVFMKQVIDLVNRKEFGQLKSLMRGVFIGVGVLFVFMVIGALLILPHFLERIRVTRGSLAIVIVVLAFTNAFGPIYSSALTALKKFKTISLLTLITAPSRFITMLIAMPFRPLTGYFAGQTAPGLIGIFTSIWAVRKELSVKAEAYWNTHQIKSMLRFFIAIAVSNGVPAIVTLIDSIIIRQRLPELDSAAYYMIGRFTELAGIVSATLTSIIFPFTADLAAKGKSLHPLIFKATGVSLLFACSIALFFGVFGAQILRLLPHGAEYADYAWAIPWLIIVLNINNFQGFYTTGEISAGRFDFLKWWVPLHIVYGLSLLAFTAYGYFTDWMPSCVINFLQRYSITSLKAVLWSYTISSFFKIIFTALDMLRQARQGVT